MQINHKFNGVMGYVKMQLNICHYDNVADICNIRIMITALKTNQNYIELRNSAK